MFDQLREDLASVRERDPAARSTWEVLTCYPGVHALIWHRLAHAAWGRGLCWLGRALSHAGRWLTGIEIHPGATLGRRLFIDHGMGVIIGETAVVGDDVTLYQGVTLGGTGKEQGKRHPNLEDGVTVGVGAAVLGNITIGARSKVGGGAVVVDNVPADCTVVGIPGRIVARNGIRICPADPYRRELLPDPIEDQIESLLARVDFLEGELLSEEKLEAQRASDQSPRLEDNVFIYGEGI